MRSGVFLFLFSATSDARSLAVARRSWSSSRLEKRGLDEESK